MNTVVEFAVRQEIFNGLLVIGNEEVLRGIKITDDRILVADDHNILTNEEIQFFYEEWEECQDECFAR